MASPLSTLDPVYYLPETVSSQIFSCLNPDDLCRCACVCRQWRRVTEYDVVWREVAARILGLDLPPRNVKLLFKEIAGQQVRSDDELLERVQAFVDRVQLGQKGSFRCVFPNTCNCRVLEMELKKPDGDSGEYDVREDCFGRKEIGVDPTILATEYIPFSFSRLKYAEGAYGKMQWLKLNTEFLNAKIMLYSALQLDSPHLEDLKDKMRQIVLGRLSQLNIKFLEDKRHKKIEIAAVLGFVLLSSITLIYASRVKD